MLRLMKEEETRELLHNGRVGRLGCILHGEPYLVPMSYVFDSDSIYLHSFPGRKIKALKSNPRACFQVDEVDNEISWRSALAFGSYEEVNDADHRAWVMRRFLTNFPDLTPVESVPVHDGGSTVIIFRIKIDRMTGVREST
jgi:nitroimidazol reductase NimA-like FMN-containing flavoprotein (pyridoxamine 5'-phosphate oxidase superfamily)